MTKSKSLEILANEFFETTAHKERAKRCDICRRRITEEEASGAHLCDECSGDLDESEAKHHKENAKLAQRTQESNLAPAIHDAFFGPPSHGLGPEAFVTRISRPDSNFNKASGSVQGKITINIVVNAPAKTAAFEVKGPGVKDQAGAIQKALEADYSLMYGKAPTAQLGERLASNQVRPPDIRGTATVATI